MRQQEPFRAGLTRPGQPFSGDFYSVRNLGIQGDYLAEISFVYASLGLGDSWIPPIVEIKGIRIPKKEKEVKKDSVIIKNIIAEKEWNISVNINLMSGDIMEIQCFL
ncbi:hypothetical protein LCGC14_2363320 [marine sediment metagenome]|uniref:Uncharacterized protein n=1 Tax=marine sediment metagenome TaxID=412755 RepID=A0A0F9C5U4_9ZZZZ